MIMTRNKAQKTAIRQRMAVTGEPYSVARRAAPARDAHQEGRDGAELPGEERYAQEAEAAGSTAAEVEAQLAAFRVQEAADLAREAADRARDRADRAEEAAERAEERAGLAQEAAELAEEW